MTGVVIAFVLAVVVMAIVRTAVVVVPSNGTWVHAVAEPAARSGVRITEVEVDDVEPIAGNQ